MEGCGLSKVRPISWCACAVFERFKTILFSIAESPNRIPGLVEHHLESRFISDDVASTY
jgi:hypothetical protein